MERWRSVCVRLGRAWLQFRELCLVVTRVSIFSAHNPGRGIYSCEFVRPICKISHKCWRRRPRREHDDALIVDCVALAIVMGRPIIVAQSKADASPSPFKTYAFAGVTAPIVRIGRQLSFGKAIKNAVASTHPSRAARLFPQPFL